MKPITLIIIGAGGRGTTYADYAVMHPDQARVVGVAEPREFYRNRMASRHGAPPGNVSADWRPLADRPRFADAVLLCTPDALHAAVALAFIEKGYNILCEKPMAPNEADCRRVADAAVKGGNLFAVCHVLRYTDYTQALKKLIDSGAIGQVVNLQHFEPVGYWHQAHSFVRGLFRNEAESSPMLMAKSCHDLDWIQYIMGGRCEAVSSFGGLHHFRKEEKPAGAADRCLRCSLEPQCPYSAKKLYLGLLARGQTGWPVDMLTPDVTAEGVTEALRTGPYGRCVYACDNDAVDHQVVNMLFEGSRTASFTMTAFNRARDRLTRIFGTRGELYGDGRTIEHFDFLTDKTQTLDTEAPAGSLGTYGHGGGDYRLMQAFTAAVAAGDAAKILSGPAVTLQTHLMVFAAEKARRENRVVDLTP
ncbi:MAG: Gfo/Idh/MocA family oxidoreductase [Planctomycetota bacterium]|nr:Gfo/Idh/MocA family oxidoreductase [Planctomycetota bacterium]